MRFLHPNEGRSAGSVLTVRIADCVLRSDNIPTWSQTVFPSTSTSSTCWRSASSNRESGGIRISAPDNPQQDEEIRLHDYVRLAPDIRHILKTVRIVPASPPPASRQYLMRGLGDISADDVGVVQKLLGQRVEVNFSSHKKWRGTLDELEKVPLSKRSPEKNPKNGSEKEKFLWREFVLLQEQTPLKPFECVVAVDAVWGRG